MGLFDIFKQKGQKSSLPNTKAMGKNSPDSFVDGSSVSPDERPFYQPDNYYTYYSYPGTMMAKRVVTFEERKHTSYPSARGLYVGEIMLLEYCSHGKYPKPKSGYPGFWWFKYGIRDIGHALESLEHRGFIKWAPKTAGLKNLKVDELKSILETAGLSTTGKKAELVERIGAEIPEDKLQLADYDSKYELTDLGKAELADNGYVPYMHNHSHLTTEDGTFGDTFTVWDINKLFPDGHAENWRKVVGDIEKMRFGVDMANASPKEQSRHDRKQATPELKDEMRKYLESKQVIIKKGIQAKGDGFAEESQGLDLKSVGKDKEALIKFYIAIGKRFDAPALYRETAVLLRKYKMYEEELAVLDEGLRNVSKDNRHWDELKERKAKVQELLKKNS